MGPYIFAERGGIHIIDLRKTALLLAKALDAVRDTVSRGGVVLFVGTKKQAKEVVRAEAERCGMPYVVERWPGGLLTNFETIKSRLAKMRELEALLAEMEQMRQDGQVLPYTKKELAGMEHQLAKLHKLFGGIRRMETPPDMLFVVDIVQEAIAVAEANKLGIPVVAIVDTNADPDRVDYVIPGNDDAVRSIKLISSLVARAILEARGGEES